MEAKDLLSYIGLDKVEKIDDFKKEFEKKFVPRDKAIEDEEIRNRVSGETLGRITTKFTRLMKQHGVEFDPADVEEEVTLEDGTKKKKNKPLENIFEVGITKFNDMHVAAQEEIKKKSGEPTQALKDWQEKYVKIESKYNDLKKLHDDTKQQLQKTEQTYAEQIKGIKVQTIKQQALAGITWKKDITELERKGFESLINDNYKIDLDDKGEAFIADKTGKRIKSDKKAGEFKSISEVLMDEAIKNKLHQVNPHAGKPGQSGAGFNLPAPQQNDNKKTRIAHPAALQFGG